MHRNIIILFAGRFPGEKAAALFVDLNARSLVGAGARVTVVAPRRFGRLDAQEAPYRVVYLPTIDLSRVPGLGRISNFITVYVFAKFVFLWLLLKSAREDLVISNDAWPLLVATLVRRDTLYEMHDFVKDSFVYRALLRRVRYVMVTNEWKREEIAKRFSVPQKKLILERNAVDTSAFGTMSKVDARAALGLDPAQWIVMYTGHLYEWKGAGTLAKAANNVPDARFLFVGGTESDIQSFRNMWSEQPNIRIVGHVPHEAIATWQAAADVLVLPNSGKEEISVHYTSPMKLFEYMASGRPIVASDLPSIKEILPKDVGYFATPDDASSLAEAIKTALTDAEAAERAGQAKRIVAEFTWDKRAHRILERTV